MKGIFKINKDNHFDNLNTLANLKIPVLNSFPKNIELGQIIYYKPENAYYGFYNIGWQKIISKVDLDNTQYELEKLNLTDFVGFPIGVPDIIPITDIPTGGINWAGGVLAPNGKIYFIPSQNPNVVIWDANNKTMNFIKLDDNFPAGPGVGGYTGGCLSRNGKIYCIPNTTTTRNVLVINVEDNSVYRIPFNRQGRWFGGVLGLDGKIYGVPHQGDSDNGNNAFFLVIDPDLDTVSFIDTGINIGTIDDQWMGGVLGPNGKIYCAPRRNANVLILDPLQSPPAIEIVAKIGARYHGGVLGADNNIYFIPGTATTFLKIVPGIRTNINSPTTPDTVSTVSITGTPNTGFYGATLGRDKKIYCIPGLSTSNRTVRAFDPVTGLTESVFQFTSGGITNNYYLGGILTYNDKIVCIPFVENRIIQFNTDFPKSSNWMIQAYFNKL